MSIPRSIYWLFLFAISVQATAQPCTKTEDLLSIPGSLKDHTKTPVGGGSFTAAEKPVAMKMLIAAENLCKKNFSLKGGEASSWFHVEDGGFYDVYKFSSYRMKLAFYQHVCVGGKRTNSDEYTVDFNIAANPDLGNKYFLASNPGTDEFYENRSKSGYLPISIFRYLSMPATTGVAISTGKGYFDDAKNNYSKHSDVYRNWYVTKAGTAVLIPVRRKEFLQSLLEFYDREKLFVSKRMNSKIEEAVRYMAQYQKSGNKAMYQSHLENKQAAEKALAENEALFRNKRQLPEELLKKDTAWLQQAATLDPKKPMRFDNKYTKESMVFTGFFSGPDANTIYRYNPVLAASLKTQPAKPLFFLVQYRYKAEEQFSQQITDSFVKDFDFEALRKLL
jgi:hypothetical protein